MRVLVVVAFLLAAGLARAAGFPPYLPLPAPVKIQGEVEAEGYGQAEFAVRGKAEVVRGKTWRGSVDATGLGADKRYFVPLVEAFVRAGWEVMLRDEPANRDALLGLAALEVRSGRYEPAEALYLRALQIDPRDSQAQAALISLRSARADPLVTESRVKTLLAADPGAHALNFALGNQFAQQNRWAEAQQEYFKAYAGDPENPDFAYNLAVSLDHLRQRRLAHDYYVRAATLADKRGASFDPASARLRAGQLAN